MTKQIQAELLILAMVFLGSTRFLFINHTKKDSISVVPLVALIFSVFDIFVFGLSVREVLFLFLALWSTIWNFRSILRLASDVLIDRYDVRFVFISCINTLICIFFFWGMLVYNPANANPKKMGVHEEVEKYYGDLRHGLQERKYPFKPMSAQIWNFEGKNSNPNGRTIIIFVPPKTADVEVYRILLQKLARDGYSVYAGDFWPENVTWLNRFFDMKFLRQFIFSVIKLRDDAKYGQILSGNVEELEREYRALLRKSAPRETDCVFVLADDDRAGVLKRISEDPAVKGTFDLSFLDDYPTKGFGPVENTDPVLGKYLGVSPDRSGYMSSHIAMAVSDFISQQMIQPE